MDVFGNRERRRGGEEVAYATTGCDSDLDSVASRLAHLLQVQGLVRGLIISPFNTQRSGVDANLTRAKNQEVLNKNIKDMTLATSYRFLSIC